MSRNTQRRHSPWLWALFFFLLIVLALAIAAGAYILRISRILHMEPENIGNIVPAEEEDVSGLEVISEEEAENLTDSAGTITADPNAVDVLLLGVDSRSDNFSGRSDVMLLIRVNKRTGQIKMVSFMRDLLVDIPGHGKNRINTAYASGGPDLAMQTVNEVFGLNIDKYMIFNFHGTRAIIDMMGGVVINIESNEIGTTNPIISELNDLFSGSSPFLSEAGPQRLDGIQATAYMRNRKQGTDVARTNRQRTVLMALLKSLGGVELNQIPSLINTGVNYLRTNIPLADMPGYVSMLMKLSDADVEQLVVPTPYKSVNYEGMAVVVMEDPETMINGLHRFLLE